EQFLGSCVGLFVCTLATVTLPYLTGGDVWVAALRFVTGLRPGERLCLEVPRNSQATVFVNSAMAVLMARSCGASAVDPPGGLWCGLPPLPLALGFEDPQSSLRSLRSPGSLSPAPASWASRRC
ncbi:unnamed protein product, partial [Effrenium voratum]